MGNFYSPSMVAGHNGQGKPRMTIASLQTGHFLINRFPYSSLNQNATAIGNGYLKLSKLFNEFLIKFTNFRIFLSSIAIAAQQEPVAASIGRFFR